MMSLNPSACMGRAFDRLLLEQRYRHKSSEAAGGRPTGVLLPPPPAIVDADEIREEDEGIKC